MFEVVNRHASIGGQFLRFLVPMAVVGHLIAAAGISLTAYYSQDAIRLGQQRTIWKLRLEMSEMFTSWDMAMTSLDIIFRSFAD